MIDPPKALEEARKYRYGCGGRIYDETDCAYEIFFAKWGGYQCSRKSGHGINGLYCKQHAKKVK